MTQSVFDQLLKILGKIAFEVKHSGKTCPEKIWFFFPGVGKWNDGDCLKWVLPEFRGCGSWFWRVDGRLKFGVRPFVRPYSYSYSYSYSRSKSKFPDKQSETNLENVRGVGKWNDGDCLEWVLLEFRGCGSWSLGVDGRLKFGVRPLYECTNVRMYECTNVRTYVCTYVRTYVRTYVCTYVRIPMLRSSVRSPHQWRL